MMNAKSYKEKKTLSNVLYTLALPIAIFLSLVFMLLSIHEPITYDEMWGFEGGRQILSKGIPVSWTGGYDLGNTPLYWYLLAFFFNLFGVSDTVARIPGIVNTIGTALLLYLIGRMTFQDHARGYLIGSLSCFLYLLNPATIQGSLIVDIDCAMLPVLSTALVACFLWVIQYNDGKRWIWLGLLLAVSLWAKLTTPLLLFGIIALYTFLDRGIRSGINKTLITAVFGIGGFLFSWWLYTAIKDVPFVYPFEYMIASFMGKQLSGSAWERLNLAFRFFIQLALWWSPFLLLLSLLGGIERIKSFFERPLLIPWDVPILFVFTGIIGYILVGGLTFAFPKYHAPFLPIISFLVVVYFVYIVGIPSKKELWLLGLLMAVGIIWSLFMVGDPLLTLNLTIRDAMIHDPENTQNIVWSFLKQIVMFCLPAVAAIIVFFLYNKNSNLHRNFVFGLMAALLSSWLAMDITQAKADYLTRFCYGEAGTRQMISFIKNKITPNALVLATRDIVYYTKGGAPYWADSVWNSSLKFTEAIKRPDVRYVVYGVGHHSSSQYRDTFLNPDVIAILKCDYSKSEIGTYEVWEKNRDILKK